jgi:ornithine cyclodeaminase/alanine dehydrogenase-like protein (mu-crystallin family)
MTTAQVIVEDRATALREAGDVILAGLGAGQLTTLAELVRGEAAVAGDRPRVFKSVGMAWEDLVVAAAIAAAG